MTSIAPKPWIALLAIGGMAIAPSLITTPAKAADPCPSAVPISTIVSSGALGWRCTLSTITYDFYDGTLLSELTSANPNSELIFTDSPTLQTLTFNALDYQGDVFFPYKVYSPVMIILSADQAYQQDPTTPDPFSSTLTASTTFPRPPSTISTFTLTSKFLPDTTDPFAIPVLNSLTHSIGKEVPGPLPILGAGAAFGFSRKLRRRVQQGS
ncbi:MAG: hypothetical protein VKP70_02255 [Cyanobacteriota bacterium]|nr:hypothetical protein [Cyanobacteriota bacterium]